MSNPIPEMNATESDIYQYLLGHQQDIASLTVSRVASDLHLSPSTVSRLIRKLGYNSFADYKAFIRHQNQPARYTSSLHMEEMMAFLQRASAPEYQALLDQAADLLSSRNHIICTGIGLSGILAEYCAGYFNRHSIWTSGKLDFSSILSTQAAANSCLLVFSVSGDTREILQSMEFNQGRLPIILITNRKNVPAAHFADLVIPYYVSSIQYPSHFSDASQIPVIYIIEALAARIVEKIKQQSQAPRSSE